MKMAKRSYGSFSNERTSSKENKSNFQSNLPRSINGSSRLSKTAAPTAGMGDIAALSSMSGGNIYRNPARRFYDPEVSTTAIYLPRTLKQKNRWRRWFFDHDEFIGAVLELHAELPHSRAEVMCDDKMIKNDTEECFDNIKLFSMLPKLDLEYMKIGEIFIHTPWDDKRGMWSHIIPHNPDFVEVSASPFVDDNYVVELIPDDQLKAIVNSTRPQDQQLKRRLPVDVIRRVNSGRNLILDPDEVTHLARKSNPYDLRGTSIIDRIFRCYIPGTKVRMSNGTSKNIEDVIVGDIVFSKDGECREVKACVSYSINDYISQLQPEKFRGTLDSTLGHEYLVKRHYCTCGCNTLLTYKQIKAKTKFINHHNTNLPSKGGNSSSTYKIEKIAAENIVEGDKLLVPISKENIPSVLTNNQARFLGYYAAEGCFVGEHTYDFPYIDITFGLHERDTWVQDIVNILEDEFNITPYVYDNSIGNSKTLSKSLCIRIGRKQDYAKLHTFLRTYLQGSFSHDKELTQDFMYYPKELQQEFLFGYFRGDGWFSKTLEEVRLTTTSVKLAEQAQWMLFRNTIYCNIMSTPEHSTLILGKQCIAKELYNVIITGEFSKSFIRNCWGVSKEVYPQDTSTYEIIMQLKSAGLGNTAIAQELEKLGIKGPKGGTYREDTIKDTIRQKGNCFNCNSFSRDAIEYDDNYFYVPVKKINKIKYVGKVHDITVDTNHWWLGQGCFVTSNTLMYEDKLREAQITIADNFIYPLKIFKLGDPQRGWIPNSEHQSALAEMLQQSTLDPNFALIYHYGLQVDYVTVADKVMKLDNEWTEINNKKAIALGVSQQFLTGDTSYASANVGLQTQLAKYKAKRDMFEIEWIRSKLLRVMAERNGWYKRDKKELVGQYRVTRSAEELKERLIIPKLVWHKKLMMRDDQAFLTFLNNVYAQGKGPISTITMLQAIGLEIEDELTRKKLSAELEERVGVYIQPPAPTSSSMPSIGAKLKNWAKTGKKSEVDETILPEDNTFVGEGDAPKYVPKGLQIENEKKAEYDTFNYVRSYDVDVDWEIKLSSPRLPENLGILCKRAESSFQSSPEDLNDIFARIYTQGKFCAYAKTNFVPYTNFKVAGLTSDNEFSDYSDYLNCNKFADWLDNSAKKNTLDLNSLRSMIISIFAHGQITGFEEQGIFNVRVSNVPCKEGYLFKSGDLLKNGVNIALFLSPEFDIPLFQPLLTGILEEELELKAFNANTPDTQVKPYKTFYVQDIEVEKCPIEMIEESDLLFNKIYKLLKNDAIDCITYTDEVTNEPEWAEQEVQKIKSDTSMKDMDSITKNVFISAQLNNSRSVSRGLLNFIKIKNKLFIANRIIRNKKSLTDQFFAEYKILNVANSNMINSKLAYSSDLSKEEIDVCTLYSYLIPVYSDIKEVIGYKVNSELKSVSAINPKLVKNGIWDSNGKLLDSRAHTPLALFKSNINNYVNYPYLLPIEVKLLFGKISG